MRASPQTGAAIRSPCTDRFYGSTQKLTAFGIRISGLALSICAARCLRKRKRLPNRCGRLTPPQAALPCGPRRFAPRNDSIGWNLVIKIRVLTKTDRHNREIERELAIFAAKCKKPVIPRVSGIPHAQGMCKNEHACAARRGTDCRGPVGASQ